MLQLGLGRLWDWLRHWVRMRRMPEHKALGRRAEDLAHRYLQAQGMTVVGRNWTTPEGDAEIDLVAVQGGIVVFVEVKSRKTAWAGDPLRAIGREKRRRIVKAARVFLRRWRVPPRMARFDIVTVVFEPFQIRHYRDAWSFSDWDRIS